MLDHLLVPVLGAINRFVVVVSPSGRGHVAAYLRERSETVDLAVQAEPTGMLDAILTLYDEVWRNQPGRIWITWCDQIAVHSRTVAHLLQAETAPSEPDLVFPTCDGPDPYIHFERDPAGRIIGVKQRREGDGMPPRGESDMGLFSLSRQAYLRDLKTYADVPNAWRGDTRAQFPAVHSAGWPRQAASSPSRASTPSRRLASTRRRTCVRVERYLG